MPEAFDAYYKWLGIPPEEQPPNHYRLLGVRAFEADGDVIANAADQRMSHLRTFQTGKHAARSQAILNEISAAKLCLLQAERKAEYDQKLRSALDARNQPSRAPGPPIGPPAPPAGPGLPRGAALGPPTVRASQPPPSPMPPRGAAVAQVAYPAGAAGFAPPASAPAPTDALGEIAADATRRRSPRRAKKRSSALPALAILLLIAAGVAGFFVYRQQGKKIAQELGIESQSSGAATAGVPENQPVSNPKSDQPASDPTEPAAVGADHSPPESQATGKAARQAVGAAESRQAAQALIAHIREVLTSQKMEQTEAAGGPGGKSFKERFKNSVLVGFNVQLAPSEANGPPQITAIQGVFFNGEVNRPSEWRGADASSPERVRANPGYAIGALDVAADDRRVLALRPEFRRIGDDQLRLADSYQGAWIGDPGNSTPLRIDGNGRPILGLFGSASTVVDRLGALLPPGEKTDSPASQPQPAKPGPQGVASSTAGMTPAVPMLAPDPDDAMPAAEREETPLFPVPGDAERKTAEAEVRNLFKAQFAEADKEAKIAAGHAHATTVQRVALAKQLMREAEQTKDDLLLQYALFDESRKLAIQTGDSESARKIIAKLGEVYAIDEVQLGLDSFVAAERAPSPADFKSKLAENALALVDRAVRQERFDAAEALEALAHKAAKAAQDSLAAKRVDWRQARLATEVKARSDAAAADKILQRHPDDPAANETVGRYRCFVLGDWETGAPLLAKGANRTLAEVALQELAPHDTPAEEMQLGEAWLSAAANDEPSAAYCATRAWQWFQLALPRLTGGSKTKVESRLDQMLGDHGLAAEYFAGPGDFTNVVRSGVDRQLDFVWKRLPEGTTSKTFSARWTGWLAAPPKTTGLVTLTLEHDGDARLWIDQKPITSESDAPGTLSTRTNFSSSKPRALKIEYRSREARPHLKLYWEQPGGFPKQIVMSEALLHGSSRPAADTSLGPLPILPAEKLRPPPNPLLDDPAMPGALSQ